MGSRVIPVQPACHRSVYPLEEPAVSVLISHLLVPLDRSVLAEHTLPHAVTLARALGVPITLLHILEGGGQAESILNWPLHKAQAEAYLNSVREELQLLLPSTPIEVTLESGPAAEHLAVWCARPGTLALLCSHGQGGPAP